MNTCSSIAICPSSHEIYNMVSFKDTIEFTPSDSKADSDGYCHSRGSNFMFKNSLSKLGGGIIMVLILYIAER